MTGAAEMAVEVVEGAVGCLLGLACESADASLPAVESPGSGCRLGEDCGAGRSLAGFHHVLRASGVPEKVEGCNDAPWALTPRSDSTGSTLSLGTRSVFCSLSNTPAGNVTNSSPSEPNDIAGPVP